MINKFCFRAETQQQYHVFSLERITVPPSGVSRVRSVPTIAEQQFMHEQQELRGILTRSIYFHTFLITWYNANCRNKIAIMNHILTIIPFILAAKDLPPSYEDAMNCPSISIPISCSVSMSHIPSQQQRYWFLLSDDNFKLCATGLSPVFLLV